MGSKKKLSPLLSYLHLARTERATRSNFRYLIYWRRHWLQFFIAYVRSASVKILTLHKNVTQNYYKKGMEKE